MTLTQKKETREVGKEVFVREFPNATGFPGDKTKDAIVLPNNSLFVFGLTSNRYLTHCIKRDKRANSEKHADELAFGGRRISITFRHIATFIGRGDAAVATPFIVGQGAPLRTRRIEVDEVSRTLFLHAPESERTRSISTSNLMTTTITTTTTTTTTTANTTNHPVTTTSESVQVQQVEQEQEQKQEQKQEHEQEQEQARMLQAFKDENNQSFSFDWHTTYGKGFSIAFIDEAIPLPSLTQRMLKDID
jgi:hypothetical protein